MKKSPLPAIELARFAPMAPHQRWGALNSFEAGYPPFTYAPFRKNLPDLMNATSGMLRDAAPTSWATIKTGIQRDCKRKVGLEPNLQVASGLHLFVEENDVVGRQHDFGALRLGSGLTANYWHNIYMIIDGQPVIPFFDPRRGHGMTSSAMKFAFSMMNEHIRQGDPDFAEARLAVVRFADIKGDTRPVIVHYNRDDDLYSMEELEAMTQSTYEMWWDVQDHREQAMRSAVGSVGDLL